MVENVRELRPKLADSEKITINLGYVDLGHVDLMVQEGFYSNRTDFIRTAIRNQLERHAGRGQGERDVPRPPRRDRQPRRNDAATAGRADFDDRPQKVAMHVGTTVRTLRRAVTQ